MDHIHAINETLTYINKKCGERPQVGLILGSGLSTFADQLQIHASFPFKELPHFASASVEGHPGRLIISKIGPVCVAILQGRLHYYEGHSPQDVVFPTRVLKGLGVSTLIITNAAGGLSPQMKPGDFMIINDHINLMGFNPLRGPNQEEWGPRFPDMTQVYCPNLSEKLMHIMKKEKVCFHQGVYAGLCGPSYETPAEIRYLRTIGADAVGMSTVPEAITAKHMNMKVVGISCITNMAAGMNQEPLSHEDVKATGKKVETLFARFLTQFLREVGQQS